MRAILLPNGNLLIPVELADPDASPGLAEIGPEHSQYGHWLVRAARRRHPKADDRRAPFWSEPDLALLGTMADEDLAVRLGRSVDAVRQQRRTATPQTWRTLRAIAQQHPDPDQRHDALVQACLAISQKLGTALST